MKKSLLWLFCMILMLSGCSGFRKPAPTPQQQPSQNGENANSPQTALIEITPTVEPTPTPEPTPQPTIDPIMGMISNMSNEELVGQMFIMGFTGDKAVPDSLRDLIVNKHIGGVLFLGSNVTSIDTVTQLIKTMNSMNTSSIPLFISTDEEGGRVTRLPRKTELKSAKTIGATNDTDTAYKFGVEIGTLMKTVGFNMDFAPILDIWSNPQNTVIGDRAFGTTADVVAKMAPPVYRGLASSGILGVGKHFPGHGDTVVDSHYGLPKVSYTLDELKSRELIPFQKAIDEGMGAIMVAHILVTSLDPDRPASLSPILVNDLLRKQMGFQGLVITDDLKMDAISENFSDDQAAVMAIEAGCDVVMISGSLARQQTAISAVLKAVENNKISRKRLEQSVERILRYKFSGTLSNK